MKLQNFITEEEDRMIYDYRANYIDMHDGYEQGLCSNDHLFEPWNEAKSAYLFDLLGENLIVKKPISIKAPSYIIEDKFREKIYRNPFLERFKEALISHQDEIDQCKYLYLDITNCLSNPKTLRRNVFVSKGLDGKSLTHTLKHGDKSTVLSDGMKLMKLIRKISELYEIPGYEEFIVEHSQILNGSKLEGNLCLSIHPLDYMTMSDNDCNWSSCMSWRNRGEYRQGTVEMMNSPCIVVGYLESSKEMRMPGNMTWSNKKWRCLFFVDKELICSIKDYPYYSNELDKIAVKWIKNLAFENLGWTFQDELIDFINEDCPYALDLKTDIMYNDIGNSNTNYCFGFVSADTPEGKVFDQNYSGVNQCMKCGDTCCMDDIMENYLTCYECTEGQRCDCCGEMYPVDSLSEIDGELICPCCEESFTVIDSFDEEIHMAHNCQNFTITINDMTEDFIIYKLNYFKLKPYLTEETYEDVFHGYLAVYHLTEKDLTEDGLIYFKKWLGLECECCGSLDKKVTMVSGRNFCEDCLNKVAVRDILYNNLTLKEMCLDIKYKEHDIWISKWDRYSESVTSLFKPGFLAQIRNLRYVDKPEWIVEKSDLTKDGIKFLEKRLGIKI